MAYLSAVDIILIIAYVCASIGIAAAVRKRAGKNTEEFFLSGRKLPWWLAGTAMVATTFAADTPLAVTELVAKHGIAGNWLWWNMVAGTILTVFFFAKLWRRAGIMTDVEFIELRYTGRSAAFLRGFRAVYLGLFMNVIIMGWVNLAMASILKIMFGVEDTIAMLIIVCLMILVGIYSAIAGLWGVALTDFFQFIMAMAGCIVLAVVVVNLPAVGGMRGLTDALPGHVIDFFPSMSPAAAATGTMSLTAAAFLAHIAVQWWASWYPGNEPGGGGYVAQRMMSAKDERHSLFATLWFAVAHYAIRPWPWIVVGLASLVLYPGLADPREGYVMAMRDHLPSGMRGFLIAAFLAAYMSTIATHLNWGSSYLVNDLYKRFVRPDAEERHLVAVSRIATLALVICSSAVINLMGSITGAWEFIIECGAGLGLVLILRWYWWRVNEWSEIAAMIAPLVIFGALKAAAYAAGPESAIRDLAHFPVSLFVIAGGTTAVWIIATFLTKPVPIEKLIGFYRLVRPGGIGWNRVIAAGNLKEEPERLAGLFVNWILGVLLVYAFLFAIGWLIFGYLLRGGVALFVAALFAAAIVARVRRRTEAGAERHGK